MISEKFIKEIVSLVEKRVGETEVEVRHVMKNNGVCLTGLVVQKPDAPLAACIYLEDYYADYERGCITAEEIAEQIAGIPEQCGFDPSLFNEYSNVRTRLRGRLVNTEKNGKILETVPHREFLDLSLLYYAEILSLDGGRGIGSIRVRNGDLPFWGVTEEDLYAQTMENMKKDPVSVISVSAVLANQPEACFWDLLGEGMPETYILTNPQGMNGAVQILNRDALEEAADVIGSDFYILPSSIHETILVPIRVFDDPGKLAEMVRDVNETDVAEEEILSSHVYRYSTETGQVQMAG